MRHALAKRNSDLERGDIYTVTLDPTSGNEQHSQRPVLVISKAEFNRLGVAVVCPITQGGVSARIAGWAVPMSGAGTDTQGVVLCHQIRTLDLKARSAKRKETVPSFIMDEVLARVQTIID
jgi:mRNA interferase ChpB